MLQEYINRLESKFATMPENELAKLEQAVDKVDFQELMSFQDIQAALHASGKITFDDANMVFQSLGGCAFSTRRFKRNNLAVKVVIAIILPQLYLKFIGN